jgi:hypothetical protein
MKDWTAQQLNAKLPAFKTFLTARGGEVLEPTSEWEVVRFRSGSNTSIIYTNKKGILNFYGEDAKAALDAYRTNGSWRANLHVFKNRTKNSSVVCRTLRKRDGNNCFFCLKGVKAEEESEEHLLSRTHGGSDHIANKVLAHKACNLNANHLSVAEKIRIHVEAQLKKARTDYENSLKFRESLRQQRGIGEHTDSESTSDSGPAVTQARGLFDLPESTGGIPDSKN